MSDLELLFLVLVVLYICECACWVRRGSVVFRTWLGRRWKAFHPATFLGNQNGGFAFASPLPPLGTIVIGNQLPISLSAEAVLGFVASTVNPGWRPAQTGRLFRFDDIREVSARGKQLLVNGELLVKAATPAFAARLADHLRDLKKLDISQRERAIEGILRNGLDTSAVEKRWQQFREKTADLPLITNFLFAYLFLLAPALIWKLGFVRTWMGLLVGLVVCTATTAFLFRRVHKQLYSRAEDDRFTQTLLVLLAPVTTIRARDLLSRPLFEEFHPLAIAGALFDKDSFRTFAREVVRELRYPAMPHSPGQDPLAAATESQSRALLLKTVQKILKEQKINLETLLEPPTPADESCRSYCPRCLAQFTSLEGVCEDCGGLALEPFSEKARPHGHLAKK